MPKDFLSKTFSEIAEAEGVSSRGVQDVAIHRGSRRRYFGPHSEAGYTSATVKPIQL
jgi:hypothetical protein